MDIDPTLIASGLARFADAPPDRVVVGLSGGADSMALLDLVQRARALPHLWPHGVPAVAAVHVHHGLQPEADEWAVVCTDVCAALDVPLSVVRVTVAAGGNVEARARDARYGAFAERIGRGDALLLAHHFDDQVETWLFRTLRGDAVRTMPAARSLGEGQIVRPLIEVTQARLLGYAVERGLRYIVDPSNSDTSLSRNFLREAVVPRLREHDPAFDAKVSAAWHADAERDALIAALADLDLAGIESDDATLDLDGLRALPRPRQRNALRHWLVRQGVRQPKGRALEQALVELGRRRIEFTFGAERLIAHRGALHLVPIDLDAFDSGGRGWAGEAELEFEAGRLLAARVLGGLDVAALQLAAPMPGQRLRVSENGPRKPVREMMREADVPPWERARVPLLLEDGEVIAMPGFRDSAGVMKASRRAPPGRLGWKFQWWPAT